MTKYKETNVRKRQSKHNSESPEGEADRLQGAAAGLRICCFYIFFFETHHIQFVLKKTRGKGRKGPEGCGSYAPRSAWRLGTYLDYNCSQLESV